jgi:molybdopterin/thiamine biosynthesis adenylyltransferase
MKETKRYSRQVALAEIGESGQQKIQNARVLVIGAGGLGCPVLQNLAAAGVGIIGIVDGDVVEETNLHRQLLYTSIDCGKNKAITAATAIQKLNPDVSVQVFSDFFTLENAFEIVEDYEIIVDCTDTITVRYLINDVSLVKKIPFVYASIHKFDGQVSVFNYKNGPSYRCLFPEKEGANAIPNCVEAGVLGVLPNTLGVLQATEVLKIILGIGTVLSGKLLIYEGLQAQTQLIDFQKNPKQIEKGIINGIQLLNTQKITFSELLNQEQFFEKSNDSNVLLIDVREEDELPRYQGVNVLNIPLNSVESFVNTLNTQQEIVLFCQTGQRSSIALQYIKKLGFNRISHLKGGIQNLEQHLKK